MRVEAGVMAMVALLAAAPAFAAETAAGGAPAGMIVGYPTRSELDIPGRFTDDGVGYGFRGWSLDGLFLVGGEYQTTTLSGDRRLDSLRLGAGVAAPFAGNARLMARVEYVDFGADVNEDGFGAHLGATVPVGDSFGFFGTVGSLRLRDTEGLELNVGGHVARPQALKAVGGDACVCGPHQCAPVAS